MTWLICVLFICLNSDKILIKPNGAAQYEAKRIFEAQRKHKEGKARAKGSSLEPSAQVS